MRKAKREPVTMSEDELSDGLSDLSDISDIPDDLSDLSKELLLLDDYKGTSTGHSQPQLHHKEAPTGGSLPHGEKTSTEQSLSDHEETSTKKLSPDRGETPVREYLSDHEEASTNGSAYYSDRDTLECDQLPSTDEPGPKFEFERKKLRPKHAELLLQDHVQDVTFKYCGAWKTFVPHLRSLTNSVKLRHLSIVARNKTLTAIVPFLELLEPGLESFVLFLDHVEYKASRARKKKYPIDDQLILKHAPTLRHFGIHEMEGKMHDTEFAVPQNGTFRNGPIAQVCNLEGLSISVKMQLWPYEDHTISGDFDGLPWDKLKILHIIPHSWWYDVRESNTGGSYFSPSIETHTAVFLREVPGAQAKKPCLRYIIVGTDSPKNIFLYKVIWKRNRSVERRSEWYPMLREVKEEEIRKVSRLWLTCPEYDDPW
ncbi:hypothetical protein TWF481_006909 [Arthrobotrys musiformis]|uniref:HNH nuclease domain-containing protein n=1 Tax=Arthrobotrys musiformis TaxID=47236 RepID=A0AAV9W9V8_9PEZI